VVCRNKDANTAWTSASDGTLEERLYYCQNWRADVSAIVTSSGTMKEWVKYSAYGIPIGLPGGDTDSTAACDSTDVTNVHNHWLPYPPTYDVRADIDLDGDVDSTDESTINGSFAGITLGYMILSASAVSNSRGFSGYTQASAGSSLYVDRNRYLIHRLGRWLRRDPPANEEALNLYGYVANSPLVNQDPLGLYLKQCRAGDPEIETPQIGNYMITVRISNLRSFPASCAPVQNCYWVFDIILNIQHVPHNKPAEWRDWHANGALQWTTSGRPELSVWGKLHQQTPSPPNGNSEPRGTVLDTVGCAGTNTWTYTATPPPNPDPHASPVAPVSATISLDCLSCGATQGGGAVFY
jgi:RHS repeat-associated protein